ncbi:unnamed protein product [Lampetra planeri]
MLLLPVAVMSLLPALMLLMMLLLLMVLLLLMIMLLLLMMILMALLNSINALVREIRSRSAVHAPSQRLDHSSIAPPRTSSSSSADRSSVSPRGSRRGARPALTCGAPEDERAREPACASRQSKIRLRSLDHIQKGLRAATDDRRPQVGRRAGGQCHRGQGAAVLSLCCGSVAAERAARRTGPHRSHPALVTRSPL